MQDQIKKSFASWLGQDQKPETDGEFEATVVIKGDELYFRIPGGQFGLKLTPEQLRGIARWQWMWKDR